MKVEQIFELVNDTTKNILGKEEDVLKQDLSNIVDLGREIYDTDQVDNYVKKLLDRIGKVEFWNRSYGRISPSVYMDAVTYGSVRQRIMSTDLNEASENDTWMLENGKNYPLDEVTLPKVSNKFFNSHNAFQIALTLADKQVKSSFGSPEQLNSFISMIENWLQNSLTVKIDNLIMSLINNFTSEVLKNGQKMQKVNLSQLYTQATGKSAPVGEAILYDAEFLKFLAFTVNRFAVRLKGFTTLFNIGQCARFTPQDELKTVILADVVQAASLFLKSDTFHDNYITLPSADQIPYWQAQGNDYSFDKITKININDKEFNGIIGVMFDRWALGVTNEHQYVTSHHNPRAEFYNNWYKYDAQFFNDTNEQFIVFYVDMGEKGVQTLTTTSKVSVAKTK